MAIDLPGGGALIMRFYMGGDRPRNLLTPFAWMIYACAGAALCLHFQFSFLVAMAIEFFRHIEIHYGVVDGHDRLAIWSHISIVRQLATASFFVGVHTTVSDARGVRFHFIFCCERGIGQVGSDKSTDGQSWRSRLCCRIDLAAQPKDVKNSW